ncbi:hypothetical protein WCX72_06475 [Sulfurimonas sp. HSL1-6]|uniref:hypothetical protein n=1 Tax=Thiomicrolovo immobilis TaxID=3131935 RepID=UPI0031F8FC69
MKNSRRDKVIYLYMKHGPRLLFSSLIAALSVGCSSPSIIEKNDLLLGLEIGQERLEIRTEKVAEDRIGMQNLTIRRSLYAVQGGQHVVYELAVTQPPYRYHYDVKRSLALIFAARKVTQIDRVGNLGFYAIDWNEDTVLLAIAQNLHKSGIKMIYGLRADQMALALRKVGSKHAEALEAFKSIMTLPGDTSAFKSRWVPKLLILDTLITRPAVPSAPKTYPPK